MKHPVYFLYYVDEYGQKMYFLGDEKFGTWLASMCGCTKFDEYMSAVKLWEELTFKQKRKEKIFIDFH